MKYLVNFFKGLAIGVATLVPGVSGGTMAVILGVYDDLIHSISAYFENWKKNSMLLLEIGFGAFSGLLLFSRLLENALTNYPFVMRFLFIGVILGGLPVLYKKSTSGRRSAGDLIFFVLGFVIVLIMSSKPYTATTLAANQGILSVIFLFIAGIIIAVALILPGISASFMLLVLGLYNVTLNAINTRNIAFLIPIGLGVVIGTLGTAKAIEKLLKKYPSRTYMLILGFVLGSLLPVFPGIPKGISIIQSLAALVVGYMLINWISKKEI